MSASPKLVDLQDKSFDPFEVEKLSLGDYDDPYPRIHELRRQGTVLKGSYREQFTEVADLFSEDEEQYLVLGYDAVYKALTTPEIFTNRGAYLRSLGRSFGRSVSVMDPPEHGQYRRIFQKAFLPNVVAKWGETIVDPVTVELMNAFIDRGEADLAQEFTRHYPFQVIYKQLDLEPEQAPVFRKLAIAQLLSIIGAPQGDEASASLGTFFKELLVQRRKEPGQDLVSLLATTEVDGEHLPDDVLISFLRQLINAGGDTTYRGTSVLLVGLLSNPDQLSAVVANRALVPQAIEEAMRWEPPVSSVPRYVARDTELDGVRLREGAIVDAVIGSANRDPAKFEQPDRFNIFRDMSARHLTFATGPHVCIGQHLARIEMSRALNSILDRLPGLRLDPNKPAPDVRGHLLRVPEHIHVVFDKS